MVLTFDDVTFDVVVGVVVVGDGGGGVVFVVAFAGVVPGVVGQQLHTQVFLQLFMSFVAYD